jgi:hypothetical protein
MGIRLASDVSYRVLGVACWRDKETGFDKTIIKNEKTGKGPIEITAPANHDWLSSLF